MVYADNHPDVKESVKIKIGTFLGNNSRRFYGKGPVPEKLDLIWKTYLGGGLTKIWGKPKKFYGSGWTGQPVLIEENGKDYLFIGSFDHHLRKIDAETGKIIWKFDFGDAVKSTPHIFLNKTGKNENNKVIVLAGSRRGYKVNFRDKIIRSFRAISSKTGEELWSMNIRVTDSYSRDVDGTPLVVDGIVYLAAENGILYKIDPSSTKLIKMRNFFSPDVIAEIKLYNKNDIIKHKNNLVVEASPALCRNRMYIAAGSGHIYGINIEKMKIEWDFYIGSDLNSTPVVTYDGKIVVGVEKQYIPGPGGVFLIDPSKKPENSAVWYYPVGKSIIKGWDGGIIGSTAINDEYNKDGKMPALVAFNSVDGYLYIVARDYVTRKKNKGPDGKTLYPEPVLVYKEKTGGSIATPIFINEYLITCGFNSKVTLYKITVSTFSSSTDKNENEMKTLSGLPCKIHIKKTAEFKAGGNFESTPIVWEGKVYIGCKDGYLYCLGAKNKQ